MFDASCLSLSLRDLIFLPIGKILNYLDMTVKVLTLHTKAHSGRKNTIIRSCMSSFVVTLKDACSWN